jgi:hypothetical protein
MTSDRLAEIKKRGPDEWSGDTEWLVAEVERLRNVIKRAVRDMLAVARPEGVN